MTLPYVENCANKILEYLKDIYPKSASRSEIQEACGFLFNDWPDARKKIGDKIESEKIGKIHYYRLSNKPC